MLTTQGGLLDNRLRYAQPADGYRTGIEPVLLAAGVPARAGDRVLEAGTGAGAGLMCLAARVPGVAGTGVEVDPEMAELARRNIGANGLPGLEVVTADITSATGLGTFSHAFANPPWHSPAGTPSPTARRRTAKQAAGGDWAGALRRLVRPGGTVSLLVPAAQLGGYMAALQPAALTLLPFWPKPGRAAKLILVRAALRRGPDQMLPGLLLHEDTGYTAEACAVLRGGCSLPGMG